ncbi:MAG: hypothetical protein COA50_06080 [Flavobacteriaceae bacterium]|nr:MAG: hypothetical protein COA50_06080 [Flavobacteriaceae bacterium]
MSAVISEFKQNAILRLDQSTRMITISLSKIGEDAVWKRPNEHSNSIGNLILHLCGNITQYAIASLGEKEDVRNRDAEFAAKEGYSKEELLKMLNNVVDVAKKTINEASEEQLTTKRNVQAYEFSGIGVVIHVVEHYSYHTGQIAFWVKLLLDQDLGFYDGVDLNEQNN